MTEAWNALTARINELEGLAGAMGLLEWDQQTGMPSGGASARANSIATVSAVYHDKLTDGRVGDWLAALQDDADPIHAVTVRRMRRKHDRARKLPTRLVQAFASAASEGFAAWLGAKERGDFAAFSPALERLLGIVDESLACYGPADHPYDHLLDEYDPGATTASVGATFARLASELVPFVRALDGQPGPAALELDSTADDGMAISRVLAEALGFDLGRGRLDVSEHPFTVGLNPGDVRITTHPQDGHLWGALYGTIHEVGHALYEQGLPARLAGTGLCTAASTGMHESQSRFWENFIGRSLPFCRWLLPVLKARLPHLDTTPERLYGALNRVNRSLVRIHADEVTYNLHILVRFELERALIAGQLRVADLPEAWDAAYEHNLGVRASDPRQGVLQDVHWAGGMFGYFPSYTLGNLYASSLLAGMQSALPDMWSQVEQGQFGEILGWLRKNVHDRGHTEDAQVILEQAVGPRDPVADFMSHVKGRQGALYGVR